MLKGMCTAFGIANATSVTKATLVKRLVAAGVLDQSHPREVLLTRYAQRRRDAWRLLATGQNDVHNEFRQQWLSLQSDTDAVAAAAAAAAAAGGGADVATAAFGTDAGLADASPLGAEMNNALDAIQALQDDGDEDAAALCRAVLHESGIDAFCTVEADTASRAQSELPKSADEIVEGVLSEFQERYRRCPAEENGTVSGMHTVSSAQQQPWWPAFLMCLLKKAWAVPGFSPRMSIRVKEFLSEISDSNFWTFHLYVAALPSPAAAPVDLAFIEQTILEDRPLYFTVQGLDHWHRVNVGEMHTHAFYWPCALFPIIIGPHLFNIAIGCRLQHGTADVLSDWSTTKYSPVWNK
jgi:hypothetical protein